MPPIVVPYIPELITVHLGPPGSSAENVTVPFPDYIKNVASSEIYPTWEPAALRANILAQISYALNRVYTEYYPSRGYPFQITSSTAYDQKFIPGRNIFENISQIVDDIFDNYIRRQGFVEPLAAKFCNGTTSTCAGLSQWGSQELAQQGANSVQILRNYYGDDIELVTDAPIQAVRTSYPGTPLRLGDEGPSVTVIQVALNRISQNYPAIPKISPARGVFGPQTQAAVRKFQQIFNLTADGVVGKATWNKLVSLYTSVNRLSELVSEGQTYYRVNFQNPEALVPGDSGEIVSQLQYLLNVLSEFNSAVAPVTQDGVYGPATEGAVRSFQVQQGLTPTGALDTATWDALQRQFVGVDRTVLENASLFPFPEDGDYSASSRLTQYPGQSVALGSQDPARGGA